MSTAESRLAETIRVEGAHILATLTRVLGDLHLAEDAVQEAAARALRQWPVTGVPESPRAWLTVTARRAAIDVIRREGSRTAKERAAMDLHFDDEPPPGPVVEDDMLRLLFTCAHPALALEAQVTLALRVLCGLSPAQIAAVLLSSESAVAKRLTRTRAKIARAAIPYQVPSSDELPQRLSAVCAVVYTLYTSAHSATAGRELSDVDGCREAVRLARLVCALMPDEGAPMSVLALILLTEARRSARTDTDGNPVVLAEQDRVAWDAAAIDEGRSLLAASLRRSGGIGDPYQLQAAIAAEHATAASYRDTDWTEIVRLYDLLVGVHHSPSARLARAVAVAEAQGTSAGLAALTELEPDNRWHAVRAELLARDGRYVEAIDEMTASISAGTSDAEVEHRRRLITQWTRRVV
ncbi:putative ECF RNA polymerase sigma factor SigI [Mycolicibacterium vanbaalenii]|uniref:Putative ECF RNA polymerase sigma factor SigI n=1 Tax=Mycolicibacterium vanbaalenii TaxID=110539 RepID=A0A5S9PZU0_MYCVN|nr:sigma-70 family RNA polymerase sigma factor [Mycolicibacterium vanbaalenii]CAA0110755.1 putative ECF RNA polymerase sigma factor SigI [Mycolicibacterium vanbaalenii]